MHRLPARLRCSDLPHKLAMLGAVALLAGCTQTKPQTAMSAHVNYPSSVRILLLEPDIEVSELTAGGNVVPNAAWTQQARDKVSIALNQLMATRNAVIVPYSLPDVVGPYDEETQLLKLHSAVGASILFATAIPTRKDRFDWSLGPNVRMLGDAYDAHYALFVFFRDSFATAGRKVIQFMAAFAGYHGVSGGSQFGFASLVDLETGQVVWFNQLRSGGGDLREIDSAMDATEDLLTDFPIARRGDLTTHSASTKPEAQGQRTTSPRQPADAPNADKTAMTTPEISGKELSTDGKWVARDGFWIADLIVFDGQFHLKAECGPIVVEGSGRIDDKGRIYKIFGQGKYYNVVVSGHINQLNFVSNSGYCGKTTLKFERANSIAQGGGMTTQTAVMPNPTGSGQDTENLAQPSGGSSSENTAMIAPGLPAGNVPTEGTWVARDGPWTAELSIFDGRFRLKAQCGRYFNSDVSGKLGDDGRIYMPLPKAGYYKATVSGTVERLYIFSDNSECAKATLRFKTSNTPQSAGVTTPPVAVTNPVAPNQQPANIEGTTSQESHLTATESASRPFDGTWIFEIMVEGHPSELDRHFVDVSEGIFTVNIYTNGWRGPVSGEIDSDGKLVGIGRFTLFNNWPRVVLFETKYSNGEFRSKGDAKGSGAAPRVFVLRLFRQ